MSTKYGKSALKAVHLMQDGQASTPRQAWEIATKEIFKHSPSSQKKGCPKCAFLGLCEEGLVSNIPRDNYTKSLRNKDYAIKAVELLTENPSLADNKTRLWNRVTSISHNNQMDVVIALWKEGKIVGS